MPRAENSRTRTIVLADIPERTHLRELRYALEARRDQIAELDLEIETLTIELAEFESSYNARLAVEHNQLCRINNIAHHLEHWADLLGRLNARESHEQVGVAAQRLEQRRQAELATGATARAERKATPDDLEQNASSYDDDAPADEDGDEPAERDRLKEAYRSLARRYHPDLARTEEERISNSRIMTRINELYRTGDLDRLAAMASLAKGAEIDDPELGIAEQTEFLEERLAWFGAVLQNLGDERIELEASATCEMMRNVEQARAVGQDLIAELRSELQERVNNAYKDVRDAVRMVEIRVADHNRDGRVIGLSRRRKRDALAKVFDPFADKRLIRVGLDQLALANVPTSARRLAAWVEQAADEQPALVRLLLLTYVSELSPFPLEGLESYDDLRLRFDHLNRDAAQACSLEQALVDGDDLVEYGVKRATDEVVHLGLRFRTSDIRDAVPVALQRLNVRRLLRDVLGVLSKSSTCSDCGKEIFPVPLYRLRGLDNMRAAVCPACGHTLSSYWMPKGKDVQAVLNEAFLDFELISEWSFSLARSSVAMQLVPHQVETLTVGDLKRRLVADIFARYDIGVGRGQVHLHQQKKRVAERTPLSDLESHSFRVRFTKNASVSEADALEMVRHRIRNRFK